MKKLKEKLMRFLQGRNGVDDLGVFLIIVSFALLLIGMLLDGFALSLIAYGLLIYAYFRVLSKNIAARQAENQRFLSQREILRFRLQSKKLELTAHKTHKYLRCKKCRKKMRVPRGKGKIEVTCPHCGEKFITKS